MLTITIEDYRPHPELDADLASLGYAAVVGWPDQSPIDAALVRSLLRPAGMTATTLVLHRDSAGRLIAFAALRWPATLDEPGRLWGPVVHPDGRGNGLGRELMRSVSEVLARHPGVAMRTTDIPESRSQGRALIERAGWQVETTSVLFARDLAEPVPAADPSGVTVRAMRQGEYVAPALEALVAATRPELGAAGARDAFARWTSDSRYTPDGLLLAEHDGTLLGAALVYPTRKPPPAQPFGGVAAVPPALAEGSGDEPAEALLDAVLTTPGLDPELSAQVRRALVAAALRAGAAAGAAVARAVVDDEELMATLRGAGFAVVDRFLRYRFPAPAAS
jgi:GNAT superfamily N-acetyltransferase